MALVAASVALQHHERLDGSRYPAGLKGNQFTWGTRIVAAAEAVAEMFPTPYSPGLGLEAIAAELQQAKGTLYNPAAVETCLELILEGEEPMT